MGILDELREKNQGLTLYDVNSAAFAPYGRVLKGLNCGELSAALSRTPIPGDGNRYTASEDSLESLAVTEAIRRTVYGEMPVQAGYCNGRGFTLNAEEYHKCSEVNFTTTGLVLLLARPEDLSRDGTLNSGDVVGFYLPPDTPVEIYPRILHFAPCRVSPDGFNCLVVLEKGTNAPLGIAPDTAADGEDRMLWMKNKWLLCHPDSPQAANGAFVGITGENLTLKI